MSTKIMFIGDPHIRHTHLAEGEKLLSWIELLAEEHKPDLIVNLGDTFDDHAVIRAEALSLVNSHLRRITQMKIPMIMILGNHDMWKPNCNKYHALEVFKDIKGVTIADSVIQLDSVTYVPYLPNPLDWPNIKTDIAITHNTFVGADYGFKCADDGISLEQVQEYVVISGHIHKKQLLNEGRVIYPGTPTSLTASDANQTKGISFLDTHSLSWTFLESPFPMWRTLDFYVDQSDCLELNETDRWIVKLIGPRAEIKALLESKDILDLKRRTQVVFKTEFTDAIKSLRTQISAPTVYSMAEQYVDKIYSGAIDKIELKNLLKRYTEQQ